MGTGRKGSKCKEQRERKRRVVVTVLQLVAESFKGGVRAKRQRFREWLVHALNGVGEFRWLDVIFRKKKILSCLSGYLT